MYTVLVPEVLVKYGIQYNKIGSPQKGYRNESYKVELDGGDDINLIFYKREPDIVDRVNRADAIALFASASNLPVRVRRDNRLLRLRENSVAGIYSYLPGKTISWEAYSMKHIKLLGWAMADLHSALSSLQSPPHIQYKVMNEIGRLTNLMTSYFSSPDVKSAMQQKLDVVLVFSEFERLTPIMEDLAMHPDQQMLHLDMVRGNVLFSTDATDSHWSLGGLSITGIIDFEKTAYGHVLFDIARTLAFLLVDCASKESSKIYKYFLTSGYNKRGKRQLNLDGYYNGFAYKALLEDLVNFYLIYDFYKFLRHAPYESLADNHHYVRTRNILIERAMLRYL